ncbi:MAG: phospho-N-acetylmuramoyl-pentapeptide-transferase [Candidatus Omnitrophica bacterium CG11_big_fil_rev_8_21_14_0_20_42_13]|uniref:Phospho-N-acetylmuramoyl-pentapeptide-transferase n=1 Tax=Candidatus Ghiorseimicrobium undicola TaxID=1974746 RepID=A0A2H0LV48_9BACT|nr:MAG: phospho-N-acetylmuramoyl-pentapeptide-transferase [Candidatus Omnitrophica bacterium CG11_big_fil_rev_8_21_14_0_20_42_13]
MFYHFLYPLKDIFFGFNIFKYITFRAAMAAFTSFLLCVILGPFFIKKLTLLKVGENIRKDECIKLYNMQPHKQGTPTMGGLFIIASIVISVSLWADFTNGYILICLVSALWLGLLGFKDDYRKLVNKSSKGLSAKSKLFWQSLLGLAIGVILFNDEKFSTILDIPFLKEIALDLGIFYVVFTVIVIMASSNAVNITDGLDGLAIGLVIMVVVSYSILSYVTGHAVFSKYLLIPYMPEAAELTVFCSAIFGASLGFLWFNAHPADVFMGDTGSLSLGGMIGTIAILTKKELLLLLVGMVFVIEVLSVMIQVFCFKLTGKRVFKMSPLHHHFQVAGWKESKIIIRFWIIGIILLIFTLMTLKLR